MTLKPLVVGYQRISKDIPREPKSLKIKYLEIPRALKNEH